MTKSEVPKNINQSEVVVTDPEPAPEPDPREPRSGWNVTSRIERIDPADKDPNEQKK